MGLETGSGKGKLSAGTPDAGTDRTSVVMVYSGSDRGVWLAAEVSVAGRWKQEQGDRL